MFILGDICQPCVIVETASPSCGCPAEVIPEVPCNCDDCEDWVPMQCVLWETDPIEGTPIKKGTKMTEVVSYLLSRIKALEAQLP
jgi:hypothetical protein